MVQLYHELLLNFVQGVSKHGWDLVQINGVLHTRVDQPSRYGQGAFPFHPANLRLPSRRSARGLDPTKVGEGTHHLHE
jgi:hypothetical protein